MMAKGQEESFGGGRVYLLIVLLRGVVCETLNCTLELSVILLNGKYAPKSIDVFKRLG